MLAFWEGTPMSKRTGKARAVSNFILLGVGFGLIYWFIVCIIDVVIYYEGSQALAVLTHGDFLDRLLTRLSSPDVNEVWMRILLLITFFVFGVFVQQTVYRRLSAEAQLRELNEDLERRVQDRTAELETANEELQAFNYTVSHDLRAPLKAIQQVSGTILESHTDGLDAGGRERLAAIQSEAEKMARLIDDLLSYSRSARKEVRVAAINMSELAQVVFQELRVTEPARNVALDIKNMPRAWGDTSMLWEAMCNLVSNALKFTKKREDARIEVGGWAEHGTGQHVFYVRDNGVGFDPRQNDRLFHVFQRLHSSAEFEGTGVGLAIVQRIIARHGGRVWAEGRVNEGATIYFSLPASETGNVARHTPPATPTASARKVDTRRGRE